ncbi:MAG: hypothetical protein KCHDKBKB_02626 [Elusimicrobia bacterium]|nr:hypothetical protein [Elusimicrobiota bacterium]
MVGSLVVVFVGLEPIFRLNIMRIPLRAQWNIEPNFRPLSQISKREIIPREYIAILGDSNAEGMGDWYIEADQSRNGPFHSANILHERTGRDVIALGSSGAAPQRYLLGNLPAFYRYINRLMGMKMAAPQDIIVYFFEGNDFSDSLRDLRKRFSPSLDEKMIYDEIVFNKYLREVAQKKDLRYNRASNFHLVYNLQAANFIGRAFINFYKYLKDGPRFPSDPERVGRVNKIIVNGHIRPIPDGMLSPGLDMTDTQRRIGAHVFKSCLALLKSEFPNARFGIVYVPSPSTVYEWHSKMIIIQAYETIKIDYPTGNIPVASEKIFNLIEQVAKDLNVPLVDTRPRLSQLAKTQFVHGPYDWKHLNRAGQEALAEDVIELLEKMR